MTIMPVMNADFDAVVIVSPMFCVTNPRNRKDARMPPLRIAWPGMGKMRRPNRRQHESAAESEPDGDQQQGRHVPHDDLPTANVPPQISVVARSTASARDRVVTDHARAWLRAAPPIPGPPALVLREEPPPRPCPAFHSSKTRRSFTGQR